MPPAEIYVLGLLMTVSLCSEECVNMLNDYLTGLKSSFTGYTELRAQLNSRFVMNIGDGNTDESFTSSGGVCARVLKNGVYGLASSSDYSTKEALYVLRAAEKNAEMMGKYAKKHVAEIPDMQSRDLPLNYAIQDIDKGFIKAMLEDLYSYAARKYPDVKIMVSAENKSSEKLLVVHSGASGRSNNVLGVININMTKVSEDGDETSAYETMGIDRYFNDLFHNNSELHELVDKTYSNLIKNIAEDKDKVTIEGGFYDVILSPEFTGMLAHEAVGHTCEADVVVRKDSVCAANMGKQVASELVSLTDFAQSAYGERCPIEMLFDDEGSVCMDAPIIKDGILIGCMTNRDTAVRLGVLCTGNARASEYSDEPIIRMRNTCFLKGTSKLGDMIASINHGYYLTRSGGGNGSLKGEFNMVVSEGYEINHGRLGKKINPTLTSGLAWDALKTVSMVSDNFEDPKNCGVCGKKQSIPTSQGGPSMKLNLSISGK